MSLTACEAGGNGGSAPRSTASPTALDPATTGTITGTIRFTGARPAATVVDVTTDPTCARLHPDGLRVAPVTGAGDGVADAFVYVARGLESRVFAVPETPAAIDQRGCEYTPRVTGVRAGQPIRFLNSDDTLHNVRGAPAQSKPWNFGLPREGAALELTLATPEVMVPIRCDVHPWMRAFVGVVAHPYFATTGPEGVYALRDVPAGEYVVAVWHEHLGGRERTVTVRPREETRVDLDLATAP